MGYFFFKFHSINEGNYLFTFKEGLRVRRKLQSCLYYGQYFGTRLIFFVLVFLTYYVKSYVLWIIIILLQIYCIVINNFMLFAAKFDCFVSMLVEIGIFGVVLFGMI